MSFIQMITLAAFIVYTILFIVLRLDSRIAGGASLVSLIIVVIALAVKDDDLARGLAMYAYCLLASAAVILAIEYFRGEPEKSEERGEQAQRDSDHKQRRQKR